MSENTIQNSYILQKPVFDREIKAPKVREWNMHKDFRDRFERKSRIKSETDKNIGEEIDKSFSRNMWKLVGISGLVALIPEIVSRCKK